MAKRKRNETTQSIVENDAPEMETSKGEIETEELVEETSINEDEAPESVPEIRVYDWVETAKEVEAVVEKEMVPSQEVLIETSKSIADQLIDSYAKIVGETDAVLLMQKLLNIPRTGIRNSTIENAFFAVSNWKDFMNDYNFGRTEQMSADEIANIRKEIEKVKN